MINTLRTWPVFVFECRNIVYTMFECLKHCVRMNQTWFSVCRFSIYIALQLKLVVVHIEYVLEIKTIIFSLNFHVYLLCALF